MYSLRTFNAKFKSVNISCESLLYHLENTINLRPDL